MNIWKSTLKWHIRTIRFIQLVPHADRSLYAGTNNVLLLLPLNVTKLLLLATKKKRVVRISFWKFDFRFCAIIFLLFSYFVQMGRVGHQRLKTETDKSFDWIEELKCTHEANARKTKWKRFECERNERKNVTKKRMTPKCQNIWIDFARFNKLLWLQ